MLVLWIILGIIALIIVLALITSTDFSYAQTIEINASKDKVWDNISSLKAMENWNPWSKKDPNIKRRFEGEDGALGSQYFWESDHKRVGHGRQEVKASEPMNHLECEIEFIKPRRGTSQGFTRMKGEDGKVEVTWSFHSAMPRPFNLMKYIMSYEKMLGPDFTTGLNDLKEICEASKGHEAKPD